MLKGKLTGMNYYKYFVFFVSVFFLSCGIKGPPLPPQSEITVQKQKAAQDEQDKKQNNKQNNKSVTDGP